MNKKCVSGILMTGLLMALALGHAYLSIEEGTTMALAGKGSVTKETIPPMDEKAPARTETATFALG